MNVYDIEDTGIYSQPHCVVADSIADAERLWVATYGRAPKGIRLHSEYVVVQPHAVAFDGAAAIRCERERQKKVEGWTAEHDDRHVAQELARAAARYAMPPTRRRSVTWPFDIEWWKPSANRKRELEKAGALVAAEWDRLNRAEHATSGIMSNEETGVDAIRHALPGHE